MIVISSDSDDSTRDESPSSIEEDLRPPKANRVLKTEPEPNTAFKLKTTAALTTEPANNDAPPAKNAPIATSEYRAVWDKLYDEVERLALLGSVSLDFWTRKNASQEWFRIRTKNVFLEADGGLSFSSGNAKLALPMVNREYTKIVVVSHRNNSSGSATDGTASDENRSSPSGSSSSTETTPKAKTFQCKVKGCPFYNKNLLSKNFARHQDRYHNSKNNSNQSPDAGSSSTTNANSTRQQARCHSTNSNPSKQPPVVRSSPTANSNSKEAPTNAKVSPELGGAGCNPTEDCQEHANHSDSPNASIMMQSPSDRCITIRCPLGSEVFPQHSRCCSSSASPCQYTAGGYTPFWIIHRGRRVKYFVRRFICKSHNCKLSALSNTFVSEYKSLKAVPSMYFFRLTSKTAVDLTTIGSQLFQILSGSTLKACHVDERVQAAFAGETERDSDTNDRISAELVSAIFFAMCEKLGLPDPVEDALKSELNGRVFSEIAIDWMYRLTDKLWVRLEEGNAQLDEEFVNGKSMFHKIFIQSSVGTIMSEGTQMCLLAGVVPLGEGLASIKVMLQKLKEAYPNFEELGVHGCCLDDWKKMKSILQSLLPGCTCFQDTWHLWVLLCKGAPHNHSQIQALRNALARITDLLNAHKIGTVAALCLELQAVLDKFSVPPVPHPDLHKRGAVTGEKISFVLDPTRSNPIKLVEEEPLIQGKLKAYWEALLCNDEFLASLLRSGDSSRAGTNVCELWHKILRGYLANFREISYDKATVLLELSRGVYNEGRLRELLKTGGNSETNLEIYLTRVAQVWRSKLEINFWGIWESFADRAQKKTATTFHELRRLAPFTISDKEKLEEHHKRGIIAQLKKLENLSKMSEQSVVAAIREKGGAFEHRSACCIRQFLREYCGSAQQGEIEVLDEASQEQDFALEEIDKKLEMLNADSATLGAVKQTTRNKTGKKPPSKPKPSEEPTNGAPISKVHRSELEAAHRANKVLFPESSEAETPEPEDDDDRERIFRSQLDMNDLGTQLSEDQESHSTEVTAKKHRDEVQNNNNPERVMSVPDNHEDDPPIALLAEGTSNRRQTKKVEVHESQTTTISVTPRSAGASPAQIPHPHVQSNDPVPIRNMDLEISKRRGRAANLRREREKRKEAVKNTLVDFPLPPTPLEEQDVLGDAEIQSFIESLAPQQEILVWWTPSSQSVEEEEGKGMHLWRGVYQYSEEARKKKLHKIKYDAFYVSNAKGETCCVPFLDEEGDFCCRMEQMPTEGVQILKLQKVLGADEQTQKL